MHPTILFAAPAADWAAYRLPLTAALADHGIAAHLVTEADPGTVDFVIYAPSSGLRDFGAFTRLKAVFSLWAGVETIQDNPTLTAPIARMVDPGLTQGMVEWVLGHVLRHHLGMDAHLQGQDGVWRHDSVPPLATERRVAVLGLGVLGTAAATALADLGFRVSGWARRPKALAGIETAHGVEGLAPTLAGAAILVLLLPATPATERILDAARLAMLPRGAVVINPGRGSLIDDAALIAALDRGHLSHATLDVFRTEPLPPDHPFWAHPKVTVTPHIASATRPESAARSIVANLAGYLAGRPLANQVDRRTGY